MANLYEINWDIDKLLATDFQADEELVDTATGEIFNLKDRLDELEIDQKTKFDNLGCYIKNLTSDIEAIKVEEKALAERRRVKENKLKNLKQYLTDTLQSAGYNKFETPRCALSFRKSDGIEIADGTELDEQYLNIKEVREPNKTLLKEALKSGVSIDGVSLVERLNLQVK